MVWPITVCWTPEVTPTVKMAGVELNPSHELPFDCLITSLLSKYLYRDTFRYATTTTFNTPTRCTMQVKPFSSWFSRLASESGLTTILQSCRDTKLLCVQRFVRLFAYGSSFLILVDFLSHKDFSDAQIGLFMSFTMFGDVVISFILTQITDQVGRRRILVLGAGLMTASGLAFALVKNYWLLLFASVIGVISPSGNEIGPFKAVEESILAQLTDKDKRSDVFAWYTLLGTAGAALGAVTSGWIVQGIENASQSKDTAYTIIFLLYAATGLAKLALNLLLSSAIEAEQKKPAQEPEETEMEEGLLADDESTESDQDEPVGESRRTRTETPHPPHSPSFLDRLQSLLPAITTESRSILYRLLVLFFLDSFASGMASPSWLTYFFTTVHSLKPSSLGSLFLVTNILATISNLLALPIARRLGPLPTMVFTHLPSAVFLAMIPLPSKSSTGTWLAMAFLALRACTQSMDQAPRQAFLAAAVLPSERTAVMGWVNMAKTLAQGSGIGLAGVLAGYGWWIPLLSGAGILKASYDLLILWMFSKIKSREDSIQR
jgi:MFS family permease